MSDAPQREIDRKSLDLLAKSFYNAVRDVTYTMTGFQVEEKDEESSGHGELSGRISGLMVLNGEKPGIISISVSKNTAAQLLMYMTGIAADELGDNELHDGIAELANMVAGSARAQLTDTEYSFEISSPFVIAGKQYNIVHKDKLEQFTKRFCTEEIDILLEVYYV